jgi:hypothetical protein
MSREQTLNYFSQLFSGRTDRYGSWKGPSIVSPVTKNVFHRHYVTGEEHVGIYPLMADNTVWWGCSDIDKTDDPGSALLLQKTFQAVTVDTHVERTAHGWHVWLFATQPCPAVWMRNAFLAAHQVAGIPPKEVNPKQTNTEALAVGVGNFVRLPYPAGLPDERFFVDTDLAIMEPEKAVEAAMFNRTEIARIEFLAGHYHPPPPIRIRTMGPATDMTEAARQLTPLGKVIYRDGPAEYRDRSTTLQHLAHECRKAALDPSDAFTVVKDADSRWGKFMDRGQAGEQILLKIVGNAYR